jgi:hypothetical protein
METVSEIIQLVVNNCTANDPKEVAATIDQVYVMSEYIEMLAERIGEILSYVAIHRVSLPEETRRDAKLRKGELENGKQISIS